MSKRERKKGPVWAHFIIVDKSDDSHPPVQCKYCSKNYKRAVPERMQTHLDKCTKATSSAKSQPKQQSIFDNFSEGDQNSNVLSSTKVHLFQPLKPIFILEKSKEINMQIDYNQLGPLSNIHHLGYCYQYGIGIEKNEIRAFQLYKEAVEKGHIISKYDLGRCYQKGIGTEKNVIKAFELYGEAAQHGHITSTYELGECYQYGIGTEINKIKAFEFYKKAAEKGHIISKYNLGRCYQYGIGTEVNKTKAFEFYKEAAEKGHITSIYKLGECYQHGVGTEKDGNKAFESYKEAAKLGNYDSLHKLELGECYQHGIETEINDESYKEESQKGPITSIYEFGECY
jgi:hypothetical protein